jgi:hypothetical protein
MFRTSEKWEDESWERLTRATYGPGTRGYRVVDVTNRLRYHVDIKFAPLYDELTQYYTFIANNISDVLLLIANENYIDIRISVQSPFNQSEDYVMSRVVDIVEAADEEQKTYLVCRCHDGRHYSTPWITDDENPLQYKDIIWSHP